MAPQMRDVVAGIVPFAHLFGWDLRAGIVYKGQAFGQDVEKLDGKPCSWLVTVTDKRWAEHSGSGSNAQAHVLIFLGSPKIDAEQLEL